MKKLSILTLHVFITLFLAAQGNLEKIVHHYFPADPFQSTFSSFLNKLLNDPELTNKSISKRTDSSLFFFKADYNAHHLFGFQAQKTELRLAEMEIEINDSLPKKDTILAYQLIGYIARNPAGSAAVKKEFDRFEEKYGQLFADRTSKPLTDSQTIVGVTTNYFLFNSYLSPLTIVWGNLSDQECLFALTLRFTKFENQARLY